MLDVIGAGAAAHTDVDWHAAWNKSPERQEMEQELAGMLAKGREHPPALEKGHQPKEYAASIAVQFQQLLKRSFQHYLRTPSYLMSKFIINIFAG